MPLLNLAWKTSFVWDGSAPSLRAQALVPIQDHLEMDESLENLVTKLKADPTYPPLFAAAFGSGEISPETLGLAIEAFLLTRISLDSKLDRSLKGKATLEEVIGHYNSPIPLSETLDPNLAKHPAGLGQSKGDQAALVAFLKTLTDPSLATAPPAGDHE